jgi:hypothetical protein
VNTYLLKIKVLEKTAVSLSRSDMKDGVAGLAGNIHSVKTGKTPSLILSVSTLHAGLCLSEEELAVVCQRVTLTNVHSDR